MQPGFVDKKVGPRNTRKHERNVHFVSSKLAYDRFFIIVCTGSDAV